MTQQQTQRLDTVQTPAEEEKQGILSHISLPTALAAALAAVTSFLFSSKLGLTGSLIGAGIGAIVSTIASQVYNAMIKESVEKIQDLTTQMQALADEDDATQQMSTIESTLVRPMPPELAEEGQETAAFASTRIAPDELREEAARRHAKVLMRRTFVVAAITALLALAGYAAIVNVATQGQGIGPTLEQVSTQRASQDEEETTQEGSDEDTSQTDAAATEQSSEQAPETDSTAETDAAEEQSAAQDDQATVTPEQPSSTQEEGAAEASSDTGEAAPSEDTTADSAEQTTDTSAAETAPADSTTVDAAADTSAGD